jgi:hypothetical protein
VAKVMCFAAAFPKTLKNRKWLQAMRIFFNYLSAACKRNLSIQMFLRELFNIFNQQNQNNL